MIDRCLDVPVGLVRVGIDVAPAAFDEVEQIARRLPGVELLRFGALAHLVGRGTHAGSRAPREKRDASIVLVAGLRVGRLTRARLSLCAHNPCLALRQ